MPGLRNMQEVFCNNQPGPDGLSAPAVQGRAAEGQEAHGGGRAEGSTRMHTLPYSYDVVPLALGMDTAAMLYDDLGTTWADNSTSSTRTALA